MKYGSVCSGIEAASVAWEPLGWKPRWFSEIDPFPCAVLAYHYQAPNLGDMTKYKEWPDGAIDVLVGGTPCQSFSVAGLRRGLDDPRGNLMLVYLGILDHYRPRWMVWENVPGVLSSGGGRDFGTFLGGLGELGYGFAYAVLDAQYFGVPQRRRRVFVVGYLGDWRPPAAVLFERESLSGNPPPRRQAGQDASRVAGTLAASGGGMNRPAGNANEADFCVAVMAHGQANAEIRTDGGAPCLSCNHEAPIIAHTLRGEGFDASEDGTGRGTPLVPVIVNARQDPCVSFDHSESIGSKDTGHGLMHGPAVRRLTPKECARLQGFPDDYLDISYRGKPAPDGVKYKALGNSMAVPVMRWIGQRIQKAEGIMGANHGR